ncbi:Rieske Fe-S protein [Gorgonomyces haynaldii]|nr:Rieske Fe-S protein [Gorgonomyces haynaldii]
MSLGRFAKTTFTTPSRISSIGTQVHHATVAPTGLLKNAQVSQKTVFAGLPRVQKRMYSAPAQMSNGDVMQPPENHYAKNLDKYDDQGSRNSTYFLMGTYSLVGAMAAKNIVTDYLQNLSASADVLALAKVEVSMASIPEGRNVVLKWRGKPIFIRHRTQEEIAEANSVNVNELIHKETDAERTKKPEWLVMLGVCTHLGCVPIGEAGDFGGWFCPCHGSHYDISGRIRKGPAPLNLEIPEYAFNEEEGTIVIG